MKWISVKDMLPKNEQTILCSDGIEQWVAIHFKAKRKYKFLPYPRPIHDDLIELNFLPTHWMKLPEVPHVD